MTELGMPAHRLLDANMLNFSGGMQQKIIIARWLLLDPKLLILDEPTKGVDIGTRAAIYGMLKRIAANGVAMLVISSDFEELLGLAERIVVISDGATVADMPAGMLDEGRLTLLAAPRSSAERNRGVLRGLAERFGAAAFWVLVEGERVFCLDAVVPAGTLDPGFSSGQTLAISTTKVAAALLARNEAYVEDPEHRRASLLIGVRGRRGGDLGLIGLSVPLASSRPPTADVRGFVHDLIVGSP